MPSHILIADTETLTRMSLQQIVRQIGIKSVTEVASCGKLQNEISKNIYTHLITELYLSDGSTLEILPNIQSLYPQLRILFFSTMSKVIAKRAMNTYHIQAYISKQAAEKVIIANLELFLNNQPLIYQTKDDLAKNPFDGMSPRQMEVLHYLLMGFGTRDIARTLNVTMSTISAFKKQIFKKTETSTLPALIELARIYNIH